MTNRLAPSALLLSLALVAIGCRTVSPPSSTQSSGGNRPSANNDAYDRAYQTETHHRHHHGRRDNNSDDHWTRYDREEPSGEPSGDRETGRYLPRGDDARGQDTRPESRSGGHRSSRALTSAPGQFDFYLLNLSWSPEFCHSHPDAAECTQHRGFTLHGLWPQNSDGTYPEDCSEAPGPASPSQYADIYPDPTLLQHEWQMHGTCSGLAPDAFFALARRAEQSIQLPAELSQHMQSTTMTPEQITTLLTRNNPTLPASSVAISCGNNYLTAVEVCLDRNLNPESCSAVKTCRASQIRIAAPQ